MSRSDYQIMARPTPVVIGAKGLADIQQCLRIIVSTFAFSVPLDRAFASTGSFIDAPAPHAVAARIAQLTVAIEKYEPRVKVSSIDLQPDPVALMDGKVYPVISFTVKEGVEL